MDTARFQSKVVSRIARTVGASLGAIALLATLASTSSAIPLAVGTTAFAVGEPDPIAGILVPGTGIPVPFAAATFSGTLTSSVYTGDASNPYGLGALTFTYLLTNDAPSPHALGRLTIDDFSGFLTDVSFQLPAAGTPPALFSRSAGTGGVMGFTYVGPPLGPGEISPGTMGALLVIQTDATLFGPTVASVIDGSVAMVSSWAPVPEPSTLVLGGLGLVGLVAVALRRRSNR